MQTSYVMVYWTAPNAKEAKEVASALVENKLAACGTMVPKVQSIFTWKGKVEVEEETLVILKTKEAVFEKLRDKILELASYEVPEILKVPIAGGNQSYLDWMDEVLL